MTIPKDCKRLAEVVFPVAEVIRVQHYWLE